jgi:cytochrome c oxidase assembly factor CtaG
VAVTTVLQLLLPAVLGIAYYRRVPHLARHSQAPSTARQVSFAGGLLLLAVATVGPMDELGDDLVFGHMIQHTMLTDEAALLLAIGLTGPVLRPILSAPGLRHLRALMHPVVAIVLWIVVIYAWHVPTLYEAAAEHTLLHLLEHASFLGAGLVMWLALLGPLPKPEWFGHIARVGYIAVVYFSSMGLANILMWSGTVLYPVYAEGEHARGIAPLTDQSLAGAILMIQGGVVMLGVFLWVLIQWARQDTERQELIDLADRLNVPLSDKRAARAAAAGRGSELRERLEQEASRRGTRGPEPATR